jgi:hypothetical protein
MEAIAESGAGDIGVLDEAGLFPVGIVGVGVGVGVVVVAVLVVLVEGEGSRNEPNFESGGGNEGVSNLNTEGVT